MSRFVLTAQLQLQAPNNVAQVVRQIQSQLSGINVNLNVQGAAQAQRQLQNVTAQTNAASTAAERMGRTFQMSIRRFAAFSIATRAVSLFTSTLADSIQTAIDFERQMVKISQVTGDSMAKLKGLTKSITDLATGLGVGSQSLLEASTLLLQAGISAKDTEVALKTLAKAALAPNFDSLSETTEGAIAILAQFGEGVGALEKQLGSINAVAGAFAVEAGDLIDVIRRAGGVFKSSGGDLNELIALFTSVRATTRESAESIGTGLRTIFTRIQRPKTIEFLKQFGVELTDVEGKFVGPYEAVKRLSSALAGLGEGDITFIRIAEELGGFRQIGKVLPLLQQFSTAQNALNVANKAGNSLTQDAATAQQALAIRILKVREEFLALVRGMTETKSFQIMANTALALASALIKIGEALKPVLPMLAAVAAIKIASGMGDFVSGMIGRGGGGRGAARRNQGGKIHRFARGGMVPGSGNRDTVPAMLQPGEFVIKKSSVNKLGAGNLAAMNENKYAVGGMQGPNIGMKSASMAVTGKRRLTVQEMIKASRRAGYDIERLDNGRIALSRNGKIMHNNLTDDQASELLASMATGYRGGGTVSTGRNAYGDLPLNQSERRKLSSLMNPTKGTRLSPEDKKLRDELSRRKQISSQETPDMKTATLKSGVVGGLFLQKGSGGTKGISKILQGEEISGFPGVKQIKGDVYTGLLKSQASDSLRAEIEPAVSKAVENASINTMQKLEIPPLDIDEKSAAKNAVSRIDLGSIEGHIFEAFISAMTGARLSDPGVSFDFINPSKSSIKRLENIFGSPVAGRLLDAKRTLGTDTMLSAPNSISNKVVSAMKSGLLSPKDFTMKNLGGIIQRFAVGGIAQAPLIDDIVNASGTMMPRPSSAIAALIRAGGGAIDIDRTLKRTIGDKAYGMAKTSGQQSAALDKYFRDPKARLQDVTSAPLTTFGKELQSAIKSGQLKPGRLSIISKSQRVPGVAEYLNKLFGIPLANMIFTSGSSKQPAMDALRNKGPRANRIARFAAGGGVGTDTVPALLTPGEFVVNRSSAQRIGYGNLNRMNKVGKYARGGVVQHFAAGTTGTGAKSVVGNIAVPGFDTKAPTLLNKIVAKLTGTFSLMDVTIAQGSKQFLVLRSIVPNLAKSLANYAKASGYSQQEAAQLTSAYSQVVNQMLKQGASNSEIATRMQPYIDALKADTQAKLNAAKATTAATAATGPAPATRSGPMGSPGSIPGMAKVSPSAAPASGPSAQSNKTYLDTINNNRLAFASLTSSLISGFLPALDENSGALLRLSHGALSLITTLTSVGAALEAFGVKLGASQTMDFLQGKGVKGLTGKMGLDKRALGQFVNSAEKSGIPRRQALQSAVMAKKSGLDVFNLSGVGKFTKFMGQATNAAAKLAGPLIAIAGSAYIATKAFSTVIEGLYNFDGRLKQAVESGNIEKAKAVAGEKASFEGANVVRGGGATAGAVIGFVMGGPIGAAIGAGIGAAAGTIIANILPDSMLDTLNVMFGGNTRDSAIALAAAQAGAVKTQKELDQAQKTATNAMKDFEDGTISASEALTRIRVATAEVGRQEKRSSEFAVKNLENRGGTFRDVMTLGGLLGESSSQRNQRLGQENATQIRQSSKFQSEAFQMETGARTAMIRSGFARGKSKSEIEAEAVGNLRTRRTALLQNAQTALRSGDEQTANAFNEAASQLDEQIKQTEREMESLEKEVIRAKAAFDAMNLGLRGPIATANAMSASMTKFASGLEVGGNMFVANTEFLSQAVTSAAQAMNPDEIKKAVTDVSNNLSEMGASPQAIRKFEDNTNAFVQAQQNYNQAFQNIKGRTGEKDFKTMSADTLKDEFAKELTAGLGDDAKKNLSDIIKGMELSPTEVDAILGGNLQVFGDKLSEAGQKQLEEVMKIAQERSKAEQVVIGLINKRAESETKLAAAQKEAIDLYMEGREVQAKYGGPAVTTQEKRATILAKANTGAAGAGINRLRTGSAAELRARNVQIATNFGQIEGRRREQGGMAGTKGVELSQTQQNLEQAQKDQVQTIRDLIKLEEEELKIIQEKNRLEKDSLESLLTGDIEKFMEGQAASGAQAALATGNTGAAAAFGPEALAKAFQDIQRQQEAGVQSMFGRQLGGPGGLTQQAAGAALASRGVTDPRMAQVLAGQTAEEQEVKNRLQELGTALGEAGEAAAQMAEMQVQTATINVTQAEIKLAEISQRGAEAAAKMNRGGIVYANRGIFVPRGSDTVPAMLTPGEFVVRREAVNRGNNLQLLRAINNNNAPTPAMARGGRVGYYNRGGSVQYKAVGDLVGNMGGIDPQLITNLSNVFSTFTNNFNESIRNLQNTKIQVSMSPTTVNVNIGGMGGGSMLNDISDEAKKKMFEKVVEAIKTKYGIGSDGKMKENTSTLAKPAQGS